MNKLRRFLCFVSFLALSSATGTQATESWARTTINVLKSGSPTLYNVVTDQNPNSAISTQFHEEELTQRTEALGEASRFLDLHASAGISRGGFASAPHSELNRGTTIIARGESNYYDIVTGKQGFLLI